MALNPARGRLNRKKKLPVVRAENLVLRDMFGRPVHLSASMTCAAAKRRLIMFLLSNVEDSMSTE